MARRGTELADEHDGALLLRRRSDIEAQVDLLERPVPGNRQAKQPGVGEEETDQADQRLILPPVQHRAGGTSGSSNAAGQT